MGSDEARPTRTCHVLAVPFPGRGDINPVLNLCESVVSRDEDIDITLAVNEEWFAVYSSEPRHRRIQLACVENVQLSELVKAGDFRGFIEAVLTKMEAPLEQLLDRLEKPPCLLISDAFLMGSVVSVADRRNIPVAAFWPTSAAMFTLYQHFHLLEQNGHFPADLLEKGNERVDYIPGLSSTSLREVLATFDGLGDFILPKLREAFSLVSRARCVLLSSIYELEQRTLDALNSELHIPLYTIASPGDSGSQLTDEPDYFKWLDNRTENSVLYIGLGSHVPVSPAQMEEFVAGLVQSGLSFMLVARSETDRLREACGDRGFVVPWCDQFRVLSHKSVGGFWSHCGWNSIKEGVLAGVPFLTFPVYGDQIIISKLIVDDWKTGWRLKKKIKDNESVIKREEIAEIVKKFMNVDGGDDDDYECREMRRRAKELQEKVLGGVGTNGSFENGIGSFISDIRKVSAKC